MGDDISQAIRQLQLKMLRIQQGVWRKKERVIIIFEGMDAAGKGGVIKRITAVTDPRGVRVHPIGPPSPEEQGKHWLYRFWVNLPSPGQITIFDRSWYGRVLVERVDKLTPEKRWREAFAEINQFEEMLIKDGIHLIKIFLDVSKEEQGKRFKLRLSDPLKQWKITESDTRARRKWGLYTLAFKDMFSRAKKVPWHIINADDKALARKEVLKVITTALRKDDVNQFPIKDRSRRK